MSLDRAEILIFRDKFSLHNFFQQCKQTKKKNRKQMYKFCLWQIPLFKSSAMKNVSCNKFASKGHLSRLNVIKTQKKITKDLKRKFEDVCLTI